MNSAVATNTADVPAHYRHSLAIIGLSGQFPGAEDIEKFWNNLREAKESVAFFSEAELRAAKLPEELLIDPHFVPLRPGIDNKDIFDPEFFRLTPRNAALMDPQFRLLLQHSWKACEDAGYVAAEIPDTAVFVATGNSFYQAPIYAAGLGRQDSEAYSAWLMAQSGTIPTMISYQLGLQGPSFAAHSNCSSSLLGLYLAYQCLQAGDADYALVGGASLLPANYRGYRYQEGMNFSASGHCRPFDADADGMIAGEGVGVILVKRAMDAIRDGDSIYALVRGIGINNDGADKAGFYAPAINGQAKLIQKVLDKCGVDPATISYVEAHGTATRLGDPIEVAALTEVYRRYSDSTQYCGLGSVKSNIGHLDTAAGIAGCIKLVLSLQHGELPASLNYHKANPAIDFTASPFYVVDRLQPWPKTNEVRRAALSSFGIGGTNVHAILEQAPLSSSIQSKLGDRHSQSSPCLVILSARNAADLDEVVRGLKHFLARQENIELQQLAYTLQVGRAAMAQRLAFVAHSVAQCREQLTHFLNKASDEFSFFQGLLSDSDTHVAMFEHDPDCRALLHKWLAEGRLHKLAELWVNGLTIDWEQCYPEQVPGRIHLPSYPFAGQSYRLPERVVAGNDLDAASKSSVNGSPAVSAVEIDAQQLISLACRKLQELIVAATDINTASLHDRSSFEELGLDSVIIANLNARIDQWLGQSDVSLFFKYTDIASLGAYFATTYPQQIAELRNRFPPNGATAQADEAEPVGKMEQPPSPAGHSIQTTGLLTEQTMDIAIIGIAGRYPQAPTLDAFWHNLYTGKDCIEEIPPGRWPMQHFYEADPAQAVERGLSYSKWGGFLGDIDCFDPLFFGITPNTARYMDPQERLFLEVAWACLEDAGYTRDTLQEGEGGHRVGVFAGATVNNYQLWMADAARRGTASMYTANSQIFSIANRVSFEMNFTGPSLTVDTACSSSLYAIHLACESMRSGQCKQALAGGVNLSLHPSKYLSLCQAQFMAEDGRCRAFSEGGTGYVPAEAVGAVLLKPLQAAVGDGDRIYAIIKGTAASHGGKTNGYTVPNPVAQSQAIEDAIRRSGIDAATISAVEAHGTGTALGDPIEVTGLSDVFGKFTDRRSFCSLASVKSNIGHAEAAAGIAQVSKMVLQLRHGVLVKNLKHGQRWNPHIDLTESHFYLQEENSDWKRPVVDGIEQPRRAGISSFGAGGANVHLIMEEYHQSESENVVQASSFDDTQVIIPLSARTETALRQIAGNLVKYLRDHQADQFSLHDVAYTLQTGRESMEHRLAFTCRSMDELVAKLDAFLNGRSPAEFHLGRVRRKSLLERREFTTPDCDYQAENQPLLMNSWTQGVEIDWRRFYSKNALTRPRRLSLPSYPFARERYWIESENNAEIDEAVEENPAERTNAGSSGRIGSAALTTLFSAPYWRKREVLEDQSCETCQSMVLLCDLPKAFKKDSIRRDKAWIFLDSEAESMEQAYVDISARLLERIKDLVTHHHKQPLLLQVLLPSDPEFMVFQGLTGLLKTLHSENPKIFGQLIFCEWNPTSIKQAIEQNRRYPDDVLIRYQQNQAQVWSWRLVQDQAPATSLAAAMPWKEGGVYLLTGGTGHLGRIVAEEIVHNSRNTTLILTGRSELDEDKRRWVQTLVGEDQRVLYRQMDAGNSRQIADLCREIIAEFGNINGILHIAGVIRDSLIVNKSLEDFQAVLSPKVFGCVHLDEATRHCELDFFLMFSSGAAIMGNPGQVDYATANAFMDAFASWRNLRLEDGQRSGKSLSINWPLWRSGGMQVDSVIEKALRQKTGMVAMPSEVGVRALIEGLGFEESQLMVLYGEADLLRQGFAQRSHRQTLSPAVDGIDQSQWPDLRNKTCAKLRECYGACIGMPVERIDVDEALENYGLDSIVITQMSHRLDAVFDDFPTTVFFEFSTLRELATYLVREYPTTCIAWTGSDDSDAKSVKIDNVGSDDTPQVETFNALETARSAKDIDNEHIAIIGLSGRYPLADNLESYWNNLRDGVDCITEIPADRWAMQGFFRK